MKPRRQPPLHMGDPSYSATHARAKPVRHRFSDQGSFCSSITGRDQCLVVQRSSGELETHHNARLQSITALA
jgi:hypothetical protein